MSVVVNAEHHWKHRLARLRRPLYSRDEKLVLVLGNALCVWVLYLHMNFA